MRKYLKHILTAALLFCCIGWLATCQQHKKRIGKSEIEIYLSGNGWADTIKTKVNFIYEYPDKYEFYKYISDKGFSPKKQALVLRKDEIDSLVIIPMTGS